MSWEDELRKILMSLRVSLDEGSEDLGVLPEVPKESVTAPAPHDLHCLHGKTQEQIEDGGPYTNAMTLEGFQAGQPSSDSQALDESRLGERAELSFVTVREEVIAVGRAVDLTMVL